MLAAFFAVTVRYRRLVLGISVVLAVVLVAGRRLSDWPDSVVVKPEVRAFAIEPSASQILIGVALTRLHRPPTGPDLGHAS